MDTISKEGFSKTILNKTVKREVKDMTEEEREELYVCTFCQVLIQEIFRSWRRNTLKIYQYFPSQAKFVQKNEADIKKFAFFRNYDDSKTFLQDHMDLVCEETANYLVLMCLNLEMEGVSGSSVNAFDWLVIDWLIDWLSLVSDLNLTAKQSHYYLLSNHTVV